MQYNGLFVRAVNCALLCAWLTFELYSARVLENLGGRERATHYDTCSLVSFTMEELFNKSVPVAIKSSDRDER